MKNSLDRYLRERTSGSVSVRSTNFDVCHIAGGQEATAETVRIGPQGTQSTRNYRGGRVDVGKEAAWDNLPNCHAVYGLLHITEMYGIPRMGAVPQAGNFEILRVYGT